MSSWWILPAVVTLAGSVVTALLARQAAADVAAAQAELLVLRTTRDAIGALGAASAHTRARVQSTGDIVLHPGHR